MDEFVTRKPIIIDVPELAYRSKYKITYEKNPILTAQPYQRSSQYLSKLIESGKKTKETYISTAAEERAIQAFWESCGIHPLESEDYRFLHKNIDNNRQKLLTSTTLETPRRWIGRIDRNGKYPRILKEFGKEVEEVFIPEGNGFVVVEWHDSGLPKETRYNEKNETSTRFWFDQEENEVRVLYSIGINQLLIYAENFRSYYSGVVFRCVYGNNLWAEEDSILFIKKEGEIAECLVCGCGMNEDTVVCNICETPSDLDCWNYNGGCATFGCGSHEYKS